MRESLNEMRNRRIKIEDLKHRHAYTILARGFKIGIWDENTKSFHGVRYKFGSRFIDKEFHWDFEDRGTACPLELICELPDSIEFDNYSSAESHKETISWLDSKSLEEK